jgi:hypothetical protein
MTKLCKDCIHFDNGHYGDEVFPIACRRPVSNLVWGTCALNRSPTTERYEGDCGEKGVFFVPRPPKVSIFKRLDKWYHH